MIGQLPAVPQQVALLFLVTEEIHTEPIWAAFLASAGELSLRQRVAPTQPSAPDVFAPVNSNDSYIDAECWKFGWSVPLHYPAPTPHVGANLLRFGPCWVCCASGRRAAWRQCGWSLPPHRTRCRF